MQTENTMKTNRQKSIEQIVATSFLNRVPEMMQADPSLTIEAAVEKAYYHEEKLMLWLWDSDSAQARGVRKALSGEVYNGIKKRLAS